MKPDKLEEYMLIKEALSSIKKQELNLRLEILEEFFPAATGGTFNEEVGEFKIKGVFRNNVTIDADAYFDYEEQMSDAERCCVKMKPSIIAANFKDLDSHESTGLLEDCITVKPGLPSLTIELETE